MKTLILFLTLYMSGICCVLDGSNVTPVLYFSFKGIVRVPVSSFIWIEKGFAPGWRTADIFNDEYEASLFEESPRFGLASEEMAVMHHFLDKLELSESSDYQVMMFDSEGLVCVKKLNKKAIEKLAIFSMEKKIPGYEIFQQWNK